MQKFNSGSSFGKRHQLTKDAAESMAIEVLGFLAEDPARLDRFLALSGLGLHNLQAAAEEPGFLAAVLDHPMRRCSLPLRPSPRMSPPP
jgi:hypothetical protein